MKCKTTVSLRMIGFLAILCVPGGGCGRSSTKSKGEKMRQNDFSLDGVWNTDCTKADWFGLTHEKTTLKFSSLGDFDKITTFFTGPECSQGAVKLVERGTYASLDKAPKVAGAKVINFTLVAADLEALSEDSSKFLNSTSYCEKKDWKVGVSTDVLGKNCLGMSHPSGEVVFDIYRFDDNKKHLTFGKGDIFLNKTDAQSRPESLNNEKIFTRE